jgi:hypothetical protein
MRFAGFYLLFVFSLALGLSCSEIPELITLTDDVSNELVEDSCVSVSECMRIASRQLSSEREIDLEASVTNLLFAALSTRPAPWSGPNLLQLLSIQRK